MPVFSAKTWLGQSSRTSLHAGTSRAAAVPSAGAVGSAPSPACEAEPSPTVPKFRDSPRRDHPLSGGAQNSHPSATPTGTFSSSGCFSGMSCTDRISLSLPSNVSVHFQVRNFLSCITLSTNDKQSVRRYR